MRPKVMILAGLFGTLWLVAESWGEESLPWTTFPNRQGAPLEPPEISHRMASQEGDLLSPLRGEDSLGELSHFPKGDQISDASFHTWFVLGKRVEPLIFRSNTTFRVSTKGGFKEYINHRQLRLETVTLDPDLLLEEQVNWAFQIAQSSIEFFNSTAMPLVGSLVSGFVEVGQALHRIDKRLKKSHLHLRYKGGMPTATYKIKF